MSSGVYMIWCLANNRYYIGSSFHVDKRLLSHRKNVRLFGTTFGSSIPFANNFS